MGSLRSPPSMCAGAGVLSDRHCSQKALSALSSSCFLWGFQGAGGAGVQGTVQLQTRSVCVQARQAYIIISPRGTVWHLIAGCSMGRKPAAVSHVRPHIGCVVAAKDSAVCMLTPDPETLTSRHHPEQALNVYRALLERRQCIDFSQIPPSNGSTSPASRGAAAAVEAAAIQGLVPELGRLRGLLHREDLSQPQV